MKAVRTKRRPLLAEHHGQRLVHPHHRVEAEDRPRRRGPLAAAVGVQADIGGEHRAERRHVAVARRGEEGLGDREAALLLHPEARAGLADVGPGARGELPAGGRAAPDRRRDLLEADPEDVVQQEGGALERRQPLEREHQRQGDVLVLSASSTTGSGSHGPT